VSRPKVLVLADEVGWAWQRKAQNYQRCLADRFDITIAYHLDPPDFTRFDLIHLFEVTQTAFLDRYPPARPFKAVAGLTAHVWETWGAERMQAWAARVDALHGNSLLLFHELKQFHPRTYYTPNGVDAAFFRRYHHAPAETTFGHVGKPNPRKGAEQIIRAARAVAVPLKLIQRTSKLAYPDTHMVGFYQGVSVMVTASNMDGTPNPMLEGAACECALLSTPIGNMPEFIRNGANGFLTKAALPVIPGPAKAPLPMTAEFAAEVQRGQNVLVEELAERMLWFKLNPAEAIEMGVEARRSILADWTWEKQVTHVAAMWAEVLG
jgi:glycosyltransferase involved in cell wall biosynthesis